MISISAAPAVTALAPETLQSWFQEHQDLVVIDVRSAAEFESMHIRGSYNVPLPLLSEHTDELAARRQRMNPRLSHEWLRYLVTVGAREDIDGWRWKIDPKLRFGGFGPWRIRRLRLPASSSP